MCVNEGALALGVPTCGSEPSAAVLGMAVLYWSAEPMAHLKEAGFDSCTLLCFLASMSLSVSHSQERRAAAFWPLREMAASALLLEKTGRSQLECGDIVMNVPGLAPQQSPPRLLVGQQRRTVLLLLRGFCSFVGQSVLCPHTSSPHMSLIICVCLGLHGTPGACFWQEGEVLLVSYAFGPMRTDRRKRQEGVTM